MRLTAAMGCCRLRRAAANRSKRLLRARMLAACTGMLAMSPALGQVQPAPEQSPAVAEAAPAITHRQPPRLTKQQTERAKLNQDTLIVAPTGGA